MKKNNLIFDLDGTLWNTAQACVIAWNAAIKIMDVERDPITIADINSMMGLTTEEMRVKYFPTLSFELGIELLQEIFRQEAIAIKQWPDCTYPFVLDLLPRLKDKFDLYVVSNCEEIYLNLFLDVTATKSLFKDVDCYGRSKTPKGETIRQLMHRNQCNDAIYIGDTRHDQIASEYAKVPFYFMEYGFGKVNNPDKSFANFDSLAKYLLEMT